MDSLVRLICYYLFGTVLVVGTGIVIQLSRRGRNPDRQAEQEGKAGGDCP